jgi:hypothetical protein
MIFLQLLQTPPPAPQGQPLFFLSFLPHPRTTRRTHTQTDRRLLEVWHQSVSQSVCLFTFLLLASLMLCSRLRLHVWFGCLERRSWLFSCNLLPSLARLPLDVRRQVCRYRPLNRAGLPDFRKKPLRSLIFPKLFHVLRPVC